MNQSIARRQQRRRGVPSVGVILLGFVVLASFVGPLLYTTSSTELIGSPLTGPTIDHPLGTDAFGRDVLARTLAGGRIDLAVALFAVSIPFVAGTLIGIASGLRANTLVDRVLMRLVDAMLAFPFPILILALAVVFADVGQVWFLSGGVTAMLLAFFATSWTVYARIARAETISLSNSDFIVAARVSGLSTWTIQRRHVLPNVLPATFTYAISDSILVLGVVAALPFLGAGVQPPAAEWGSILYEGRGVMITAPWIVAGPAVAMALTGVAIRLIGRNSRWIEGQQS
ncbi:ABC transporter permease [Kribbella solani]|uniref:ABC transporter permease n=1 Tax=Kribbella solani TaxID=236067 RepID=UPI0029B7F457|nr:ABC transporter permease [Kribbella solani]MDX3006565.1 ABC transporter permease [Kribbella solani]